MQYFSLLFIYLVYCLKLLKIKYYENIRNYFDDGFLLFSI